MVVFSEVTMLNLGQERAWIVAHYHLVAIGCHAALQNVTPIGLECWKEVERLSGPIPLNW